MKIKSIILATFIVGSFIACKKEDDDNNTTTPTPTPTPVASITIHEPEEGQMFHLDDTVHVDIHITADFEMHGYEAWIINESAGDTVWTADVHDHGDSFEVHGEWIVDVTDHSDMKLKVSAEIDHDGNKTEKEVHFHCHPM
jgi:hypothetical protein